MRMIIGADLVPTKSNEQFFRTGNVMELIGEELEKLLQEADYLCFNLETPLTDELHPIPKLGPVLSAATDTMVGIQKINPCFFTLANNHILDQGPEGVLSTLDVLQRHQIAYAGAGKNLKEASQPHIVQVGKKKIGFYCCTEHEFSVAGEKTPGANPFDPLESLDHIAQLRQKADYVIVLYHGGKEHDRYPTPRLQKVCRKIVDQGADLVICQHSHCIGCKEEWNRGVIVYGQGNFLFDHSASEYWQTSLLMEVRIEDEQTEILYHPLVKKDHRVRLAGKKEAEKILADFEKRSEEIQQEGFVEDEMKQLAREVYPNYISNLHSSVTNTFLFRGIDKITRGRLLRIFLRWKMNRRARLALRNYVECETHQELLLAVLKEEINQNDH